MALDNTSLPLKKKTVHKKTLLEDVSHKEGHYLTLAYATANNYDLKALREGLVNQKLYEPETLKSQDLGDVVVAHAVYSIGHEPREIIFFREGAVVFWNCTELEANNVLDFIRPFEMGSYPNEVVNKEREVMKYEYQVNVKRCSLHESSNCFVLVPNSDNSLERYTFSHAMAQSARLGAWEARLEALAADVRALSMHMERDGAAHVDKKVVVRKLGELFSLRHQLCLESDLLDTHHTQSHTSPYQDVHGLVLNERLSHCVELLELLSSWAADRHHVRLEWMVIALILAEVCFELLHCYERYMWNDSGHSGKQLAPTLG
ncbi:required for meiotic nuclear division protein 1 [Danaus plexippus plexippus]|uniref:Required for meiotic nuclear division protein 1 n=1 Tax=Danaus plexippus plexippus TaxID=278856 RepID=A0A212FM62_DANPL|nr:required for meiotic nuclear division protein 1 [Danaus plexippus plexippus]